MDGGRQSGQWNREWSVYYMKVTYMYNVFYMPLYMYCLYQTYCNIPVQ